MADPATITSISAFMASWFTPSSIFLFLNLVIGTIVLTSRFATQERPTDQPEFGSHDGSPQLVRSSSLLQRFKSFHFGLCKYDPMFPEKEYLQTLPNSHQLVRTPSLLERVKSLHFGLYNYEPTVAETKSVQPVQYSPQLVRTPSLLERVKSFNFGLYNYEPAVAETESVQPDDPSECENPSNSTQPQLARAPSLLELLKSINLSSLYRSDTIEAEKEAEVDAQDSNLDHDSGNLVKRSKSETHKASRMRLPEKMKKLASNKSASRTWEEEEEATVERRRPGTAKSEMKRGEASETGLFGEDEAVDAKADDFINRFKQQLKLQRLDSILRNREMLKGN